MRERQFRFRANSTSVTSQEDQILVDDIVRYLSGLARIHSEEKIGNPELSLGLRQLVSVLQPYAGSPLSELGVALQQETRKKSAKSASDRLKVVLPSDLESLGQADIERILEDDRYTKQQVAELGDRRFGMSKSSLIRLRKDEALQSIRAALEHERSLDVISEEARRGGKARAI